LIGRYDDGDWGLVFDFNHDSLEIHEITEEPAVKIGSASICDKNGRLVLYAYSQTIADSSHQPIVNGEGLSYYAGTGPTQLFLPVPEKDNQVVLFRAAKRQFDTGTWGYDKLYFNKMVKDSEGVWTVIVKDSLLLDEPYSAPYLTACRHGNGVDWWVLKPKGKGTNKYFKWLLTKQGISGTYEQEIGLEFHLGDAFSSSSVFTPDGSKYVTFSKYSGLKIFDFDRCTGELSNPVHIPVETHSFAAGSAISPNSRYLYLFTFLQVIQFDLWATDIEASKTVVAEYDNFVNRDYRPYFLLGQLAPDGKIYIRSSWGFRVIHVIEHPDSAGVACKVVQHKHILPIYMWAMPRFPNFRLGALAGSVCDTLTAVVEEKQAEPEHLSISPNPAVDEIYITLESQAIESGIFKLYNNSGQLKLKIPIHKSEIRKKIDVSNFPPGLYFYKLFYEDKEMDAGKIIIGL